MHVSTRKGSVAVGAALTGASAAPTGSGASARLTDQSPPPSQ